LSRGAFDLSFRAMPSRFGSLAVFFLAVPPAALVLGCSCGRSVPDDAAVPDAPMADVARVDAADAGPDAPAAECLAGLTYCRAGSVLVCGEDGAIVSETPCETGTICSAGACVSPCEAASAASSYEGCRFRSTAVPTIVVGHGGLRIPELGYGFHNPGTTDAVATIRGGPDALSRSVTVPSQGSVFVTVPLIQGLFDRPAYGVSPTVLGRDTASYAIESSAPIVAYEFSPEYALLADSRFLMKADATVLLPEHAWGTEYLAVTMPPLCARAPCHPEEMTFLQVIAGTDGTAVTVVPAAPIEASVEGIVTSTTVTETPVAAIDAGASMRFELDAGDVLQLASAGDLTGTKVVASEPVQVLSGNVGIRFPGSWTIVGDGHAHDAMLPLRAWGSTYVVAPPPHPTRAEPLTFSARFVAGDAPVMVTFDPPVRAPLSLPARGRADLSGLTEAFVAEGSAPFLAVALSTPSDVPTGDELGQPIGAASMVAFPPLEQWRGEYAFSVPPEFDHAHVTMIHPSGASVTLDGAPVTGSAPIGSTGWSFVSVPLDRSTASHVATGTAGFGLLVYGQAPGTSYWYAAGLDLEELF